MELIQRTLEVERVINLIAAFGWKVIKEEVVGDKITINIEKIVPAGPASVPAP